MEVLLLFFFGQVEVLLLMHNIIWALWIFKLKPLNRLRNYRSSTFHVDLDQFGLADLSDFQSK